MPTDYSLTDSQLELDEEAKYAIFVKRAVHRFEAWWDGLERVSSKGDTGRDGQLEGDRLPPLDVLMVWHDCKGRLLDLKPLLVLRR